MQGIVQMLARIAEVERKLDRLVKPGVVKERDHKKGVRLSFGKDSDGNELLSNWVQPADQNKGTRSRWLPEIGAQLVAITMPGADQVLSIIPHSHHEGSENPAPKDDATVLYADGKVSVTIFNGDSLYLSVGGSEIEMKDGKITIRADAIKFESDTLDHNGVDISESHKHTEVEKGGDISGPPVGGSE